MRRPSALLVAVAVVLLGFAGCGGGDGEGADGSKADEATTATDLFGHEVPEGQDWSGEGAPNLDGAEGSGSGGAEGGGGGDDEAASATDQLPPECFGPTTTPTLPANAPPGVDPEHPFGEPAKDYPVTVSASPKRGPRGTKVHITVLAPTAPQALAVILAGFRDNSHHGMTDAKVTDATGRAEFDGPIPQTAPLGAAKINVSVSTPDNKSTLESLDFLVTGPGCDP